MNIENFISQYITRRPESLLAGDFLKFDRQLAERINGKRVLVIGGAGTIGSFYIKALLKFRVESLVVVDISENGLTELVRDLRSSIGYNIPEKFITYPLDFGSPVFEKIFKAHGPFDIVANFAAHKHVRSEKDIFSIEAMIENNVLKARKLLELLLKNPPEHFFCVSTDKAANPVNIMGASKKLMEELIMAYSDRITITTARFANVAFSNGSLPAGFLERLNKNQPWSCPLNIKRFFVSPVESGELCLMASVMGESGDIFYPKLDPEKDMIPFDQIARDLAAYLGLELVECSSEEEAKQMSDIRCRMSGNQSERSVDPDLSGQPAPSTQHPAPSTQQPAPSTQHPAPSTQQPATSNQHPAPSTQQPVFFFPSDTSGEKPYEEFYTENEVRDEDTFVSLGVIKAQGSGLKAQVDNVFRELGELFDSNEVSKAKIVDILKEFLPGFDHIETGKGLDSKM